MSRAEVAEKVKGLEGYSRADLHEKWIAARRKSGLGSRKFESEVHVLRNVYDGRCPDGCCGNEDQVPWKPTPQEWVVLAETIAEKYPATPAQRTSGRVKRTG